MSEKSTNGTRIGIAGGGQLAQMMLPPARELGLRTVVLDPDPHCSSADEADVLITGDFGDAECLATLAAQSDLVTFEIEKVNAGALAELTARGHTVRPSAETLRIIQDKFVQKSFLHEHGIAVGAFVAVDSPAAIDRAPPFVWKARRDGYDGRGVAVVRTDDDLAALADAPALIEDLVDIDYELATLIARDPAGNVAHYPVTEIVMDPHAHVMDMVIAPAAAPAAIQQRCTELAAAVAAALDYVGILALEFFVDRTGHVMVNEVSPRPHNSGHYTIEACHTSQFEQHVRAVAGLPLGSPDLHSAAVTFNVLGSSRAPGPPRYVGFEDRPQDGVHVHCYDKPEVRPGRKMGHVTVLAADREAALARTEEIRAHIRVESANE